MFSQAFEWLEGTLKVIVEHWPWADVDEDSSEIAAIYTLDGEEVEFDPKQHNKHKQRVTAAIKNPFNLNYVVLIRKISAWLGQVPF